MSISPEFLAMLACPACRGPLTLHENEAGLVCPACSVVYPVRDGIPVMLVEEARPLSPCGSPAPQSCGSARTI